MVMEIEVSPAEVDRHFATAYRHVAERTKVPGFRPGKAPRHVIDRFVGRAAVVAEAVDHLVNESYDAALDQAAILPLDQPVLDLDSDAVVEGATVRFTATVPIRPEVSLGAYADSEVPIIASGEGCYVWDRHGKRYLVELSKVLRVARVEETWQTQEASDLHRGQLYEQRAQ